MAEGTGDYQEEVLSDLLDLQAELRGDAPRADAPPATPRARPVTAGDAVTVAEGGFEVSLTPTGASVTERLSVLNERLSRLEGQLASVTKRIDGAESEPEATPDEPATDVDARWRSFLDLQRIVADRLDGR